MRGASQTYRTLPHSYSKTHRRFTSVWLTVPAIYIFIDNLLVRIHFFIVMIRWTGLTPWKLEFPFPGRLISTFLAIQSTFLRGGLAVFISAKLLVNCFWRKKISYTNAPLLLVWPNRALLCVAQTQLIDTVWGLGSADMLWGLGSA